MKAFPKDITVQTLKKRHIGVENELHVRGSIEEIEPKISKRGLLQSIGYDGGGREFRTNPIAVHTLKQVRGYKYVKEYYTELNKSTAVINSGGTHIHISILNTDHANLEANVVALAIAFHNQLQKISGRKTMWATRRRETTMQQVRDEVANYKQRAGGRAISMGKYMLCPTYHQTFEFRGPQGSNDCDEILAWIEFLDNIVKVCNRKSIEGVQFKQLLKGDHISAYVKSFGEERGDRWRKLTTKELDKKFNGARLSR